jgi:hypothetical protein
MTYNGWKNWETWNVALWCDNEYGIYQDRMRQEPRTAEQVEAFVRCYFPKGTPDMETQDPYDSREEIDWKEIAEHWATDYPEEEETDDEAA